MRAAYWWLLDVRRYRIVFDRVEGRFDSAVLGALQWAVGWRRAPLWRLVRAGWLRGARS